MNDERKPRGLDPRLHDFFDGEFSSSDAAAFEEDLRPGTDTANQLRTLKHLGAWLRTTRPRTPSSLARSVISRLEAESPTGARRSSPALRRRWEPGSTLRWAWVPAMAALLVLAVIPMTRVLRPSDGTPKPSGDAARSGIPVAAADRNGSDTVPYRFTVKAAAAGRVCLAGDFNDWKVCEAPMRRVGEDTWSITINIPRGRHEYMFVIDNKWVPDPHAMGYADDGFGSRNSVLVV